MPTYDAAVELFERRRRAWLDEDVEAYLALWADDMTFSSPVHPEPLHGKAAYAELIAGSLALVRPVAFDVEHIAMHDSLVLAEWRGEIEARADGKRMSWRGMNACEIRHGLITWWREYWNPGDFA